MKRWLLAGMLAVGLLLALLLAGPPSAGATPFDSPLFIVKPVGDADPEGPDLAAPGGVAEAKGIRTQAESADDESYLGLKLVLTVLLEASPL